MRVYVKQIYQSLNTRRKRLKNGRIVRVTKSRADAMVASGCWRYTSKKEALKA